MLFGYCKVEQHLKILLVIIRALIRGDYWGRQMLRGWANAHPWAFAHGCFSRKVL